MAALITDETGTAGYLVFSNTPTIATPNFTTSFNLNGTLFADVSTHYHRIYDPSGLAAFQVGGTGDAATYSNQTTFSFRSRAFTVFATINSTGLNLANASNTITFGTSGNTAGLLTSQGSGGFTFKSAGGSTVLAIDTAGQTASVVNYMLIRAQITGGGPSFIAQGTDTNVTLNFSSQAAGSNDFYTNSLQNLQMRVAHTASANRYVQVTGSNGSNPAITSPAGGRVTINGIDVCGNALMQFAVAVDFNSVGDNAITISLPSGVTRYRLQGIVTINTGTTASLTTAQFGVFTSTGGGGTAVVASGTALTSITSNAAATSTSMQVNAAAQTAYFTNTTLYYRVTQAQGAAASGYAVLQIAPLA